MTPLAPRYKVSRNEDHTYLIEGKIAPGVTTILKNRSQDWLAAWKVAELCKALGVQKATDPKAGWKKPRYTDGLWKAGVAYSTDMICNAVKEARKVSGKKSDKAKDTGTMAHEWIEECIREDMSGAQAADFYPPMPADPEAACSCQSWLSWREGHEVEWLSAETFVASRDLWYGGTYDALARVKGPCTGGARLNCVIDWKTSGDIYDDIWLQLSALLTAHGEMTGDPMLYQRVGARVPKDGKPLAWVPAPQWAAHGMCMEAFSGLTKVHRFALAAKAAREGWDE